MAQFPQRTISQQIRHLREIFARFALSVTVNGRTSSEFVKSNGINHERTATYHPATNGQAERFVKTVKKIFEMCA